MRTASEVTSRHSSCYLYIILSGIPLSRLHILGIVPSVGLAFFYEVAILVVAPTLAGHTTFVSQHPRATLRAEMLLLCRVVASSFEIFCVYCDF